MSLANILQPRVCELGKIKIGGLGESRQARGGGQYRVPEKYDHFRITTLIRDQAGDLTEDRALMDSLSGMADPDGKLRQLPVSLLSNDVEEVLQAAYLWYNGKRLAAKSDGATLTQHFDRKAGKWLDRPQSIPWEPRFYHEAVGPDGKPLFKLHCTLNVVIASPLARWGGLYKFRTTSRITSDQLYGSLIQLKQLTGGVLRGLPLRLVVRPMQVTPDGKPTTVYVVHVELLGADITAIQRMALDRARFELENAKELREAQTEYRRLIAAPADFADDEEEEEVAQEFHPHQQSGATGHYPEESSDPPAAVVSVPPPEDREAMLGELFSAAASLKTTPAKLLAQHAKQVGDFPAGKPPPKVEDLTAAQLGHLLTLVRQAADLAATK